MFRSSLTIASVGLTRSAFMVGIGMLFLSGLMVSDVRAQQQAIDALPRIAPHADGVPLDIRATSISSLSRSRPDQKVFGQLVWLGGLELSADIDAFGGFSGIAFLDDENFVAVGDKGTSLSGRLISDKGRPLRVEHARLRNLPGINKSQAGWRRDAEGLDVSGDQAFVSFEGDVRILRFGIVDHRIQRVEGHIKLDESVYAVNKGNKGLEAVAVAPEGSPFAGSVIFLTEAAQNKRIKGWIAKDGQLKSFSIPQSNGLLVTDAAFTSQGDLLLLERDFSLLGGLTIQLRRIYAADFRDGEIEQVNQLFRGNLALRLDNMEGMDVRPQPDGSSLITLISDDNFSSFQSTLLLRFLLPARR